MRLFLSPGSLALIAVLLVLYFDAAQGVSSAVEEASSSEGSRPLSDLKDTFIVMFESTTESAFSRTQDYHATFYEHLLKRKQGRVKHKILHSWTDSKVISGVSIRLADAADVEALSTAPGVVSVQSVQRFHAASFYSQRVSLDSYKAAGTSDTFAPHVMTQVDRLHKEGHYGKGIKIAMLDRGVDYTHPALNGGLPAGQRCYGMPECPIAGGYDLVGDHYSAGMSDPVPDNNPFADCLGSHHGSHVAGILIANDTKLGFMGVVPQAKLAMYRVFGCGASSVSSDILISGMARALVEGADVIAVSIGSSTGWATSPAALVATRISNFGVPVVVSAGNVGEDGPFLTSNTASSEFSLSAASVQSAALLGFTAKITGVPDLTEIFTFALQSFSFPGNRSTTLPLHVISRTPAVEDACSPLPPDIKLGGKVVLVLQGSCSLRVKQQNILNRGGKYVIFIAVKPPASIAYFASLDEQQQSIGITYDEGVKLQSALAAGKEINVAFDPAATLESRRNDVDGGLISSFSAFGPTYEMSLTPNIAAPGGNILGVYPVALGSYGILSGTSQAAPYIAGVVAQYLAINGKTPSAEIRSRLMSHNKPIHETNDGGSLLASVGRAGSGLVQAYDSIFATASAQPAQLALNDSVYFQNEHWITIKNNGKKVERFTATHLPAGTAQTVNTTIDRIAFHTFPVPLTGQHAGINVSPNSFKLSPGASKKVKVTVTPPSDDQRALPVYSGYIKFTGSTARSTLTVPYLGLAASVSKMPVLATKQQYDGKTYLALNNNSGFSFNEEPTLDLSNNKSAPRLSIRLSFGTPFIETSLVSGEFEFDATIKHKDFVTRSMLSEDALLVRPPLLVRHRTHQDWSARAAASISSSAASNSTPSHETALFSDVVPIGIISRRTFQPRSTEDSTSLIQFHVDDELMKPDGFTFKATEGRYRVLVRAQHPFTDATLAASYDSWLSHPFVYRKSRQEDKRGMNHQTHERISKTHPLPRM